MEDKNTPVWLITGCSTGFGRELAKLILAKGWKAVITARNLDRIKDIGEGFEQNVLALELDVTNKEQIFSVVAEAENTFGKIDVLVNNAGYGYFSSIEEGEDEKIKAQFDTNVFGLIHMTQAVLPGMRKNRKGHIINFSSIGGLVSFPATGFYHATKYAVEGLSESLAQEVAPLGIKVILVEPGPFRTDWAGRSLIETPVKIDDYQETVASRIEMSKKRSGNQQGDPVRGAEAIITAVLSDSNNLRLLLGKPALDMACEKLEKSKANYDSWKELTLSADFPE